MTALACDSHVGLRVVVRIWLRGGWLTRGRGLCDPHQNSSHPDCGLSNFGLVQLAEDQEAQSLLFPLA